MKVTNRCISYNMQYRNANIPAGVPVTLANNIPKGVENQYWVEPWEGMTEEEKSWQKIYGFLVKEGEVEYSDQV